MTEEPTQTTQTSNTVSALERLIGWANEQNHWVRQLVNEVVDARRPLSDDRINELYKLLCREKEIVEGDSVNVPMLSAGRIETPNKERVELQSLSHIENVNALVKGQEIEFHKRLTVCFGENASGKTGYVRILKRAANVRTADLVLSNIHESENTPQAKFKILTGGQKSEVRWQGEQALDQLIQIDVFDSHVAEVHLNEDLTYSYTPAELLLFPLVRDEINRVETQLVNEQSQLSLLLRNFSPKTEVYTKIAKLEATTDLQEFETLSHLSDNEKATLARLDDNLDRVEIADMEHNVFRNALTIANTVNEFDREAYATILSNLRESHAKYDQTTRTAFESDNIPNVLSDSWKRFIEAAEIYIKEIDIDPYPKPEKNCIYCRQALSESAVTLLRKYRHYCNNQFREKIKSIQKQVQALCTRIHDLEIDQVEHDINFFRAFKCDTPGHHLDSSVYVLEGVSSPPIVIARDIVEYAQKFKQVLNQNEDCPPLPSNFQNDLRILRSAAKTAQSAIVDLPNQAEERKQALATKREYLIELKARTTLKDLIPEIKKYVKTILYLGKLPAIKGSLTRVSTKASDTLINQDFEKRFREECKELGAQEDIKLEFPGQEGESKRKKSMPTGHALKKILSEGEQKVVALADFLAEVSLKLESSPVIFDDPVNSLDYKRIDLVVSRLAKLSQIQQVVVFTHDILFVSKIFEHFDSDPHQCLFNSITAEGKNKGLVMVGSHPKIDNFKNRKQLIEEIIRQAEKTTDEVRHALVKTGYDQLRGACEIVIEKYIFQDAIGRLRMNIQIAPLKRIKIDHLPNAIKIITDIFYKCSKFVHAHSHPLIAQGIRPSVEELKKDWEEVQRIRKEHQKK